MMVTNGLPKFTEHGDNMSDRFDFEQQLQKCWLVTDDIYDLSEAILERDLSHDQITNVLFGLKEINEIRFNKLWELFEDVFMNLVREHKMLEQECAALREQLEKAEKKNAKR
jgi:hypothetical protein